MNIGIIGYGKMAKALVTGLKSLDLKFIFTS